MNIHASLVLAAFVAALAIAPVAPEAGNSLFLLMGISGIALMWGDARVSLRRPIVWMSLLALGLVGVAYGMSSGLQGLVGLIFFAPLLCVWPLVTVARKADISIVPILAVLALCGAAGAGIIAIEEFVTTGTSRAGGTVANPIHFADVALMVGFVGTLGLFVTPGRWRLAFSISPVMAVIAVVLSGTRGAVVAALLMLATMVVAAAFARLLTRRVVAIGAGLIALAVVAAVLFGVGSLSGVQRILADIGQTLAHGAPTDTSTDNRLQMYLGGLRAFLESPLVGHGPFNFTAVAGQLADIPFENTPHLHNDIVDLAASAGIMGLIAYTLLLAAPIVEVMRSPRGQDRTGGAIVVITLIIGFFVMGLTNAMFGILTVTTLYASIYVLAAVSSARSEGHRPGLPEPQVHPSERLDTRRTHEP